MKKRLILSALALLATLPMAQAAYTPLSITGRAGAYRPNDKDFGKTNLALGLDVKLNITAVPVLGGQTVSLDYMGKSDANLMGVTLVQRFSPPIVSFVKPSPYFGLGLGYYRQHFKYGTVAPKIAYNGSPASVSKNKSGAGGKVVAGVVLTKDLVVEANYHYPFFKGINGAKADGFTVTAGFRY